jgi:hypothetical protein
MVWMRRPPGVSSATAKSRRARVISAGDGPLPSKASSAAASSASGIAAQAPSVSKTRRAISAAATLVKVRQRIEAGSAPARRSRITRCVSTCVLPEPAFATTQAEAPGSDAAR